MSINGVVLLLFAIVTTLTSSSSGAGILGPGGSTGTGMTGIPLSLLNGGTPGGRDGSALFREMMKALQNSPQPPCTRSKALARACKPGDLTTETCSNCARGECCLLKPGASKASCSALILGGQSCSWRHCTINNPPSPTQAIYGDQCPCNRMCCLPRKRGTGAPFDGTCNSSLG